MVCTQCSFKELSIQLFSYASLQKFSYTSILMKEDITWKILYSFGQLRTAIVNCRIPCTYLSLNQTLTLTSTITLTLNLTLWRGLWTAGYQAHILTLTLTLIVDLTKWVPELTIRKAEKQPSYSQEDTKLFRIGNIYGNECKGRDKKQKEHLFKWIFI